MGGGAERPSLSLRLRYWSDAILIAAEGACDQPCPTRCPGHSDDECANGLACVVQADNYYEQCTNCTAESFERECAGWSKEIRAAAEAKCGLNCTAGDDDDGAAAACATDADCPDDLKCVVQADGYYAQCVDCEEPTFDTQCAYWSEPILLAAEDACLLSCPTRCPTHSDDECDGALECVVQADGNWDLCVDCTQDAFYKACGAWSDAIKTAAEEKCGLACPYEGAGRAAAQAVVVNLLK